MPGSDLIDSPDRCFEVGGDSDGHAYFISRDSGEIYVWWHDPDEITRLDLKPFEIEDIISWSVRRDSAHPVDRDWCTFEELAGTSMSPGPGCYGSAKIDFGQTTWRFRGHPLEYPFLQVRERMAIFGTFDEQFESQEVLAMLQPSRGFLVEVRHGLRGRRCTIDLIANRNLGTDADFVHHARQLEAWLNSEGFCDIDDPSVMIFEEHSYGS